MAILLSAVCLMAVAMLGYPCDAQLWKGQKSQFRPRMLPSQDELQQLAQHLPQKPSQPPQMFDPSTPQPKPFNNTDPIPKQTCDVVDNDKVVCGLPSITAARCRAINCCFDGQKCFYGKTATVQCTKDGQFVVVVARDVTLTNLKSIHLLGRNESHCKPVISSSFAIYQFKFTECGTVITEGVGQIVYENRLSSSYEVTVGPVGAITRDSHYDLLFQCRYNGSSVETVMTELRPVRHPDPVSSLTDLNVELRLASGRCLAKGCNEDNEAYTSYYTDADYPITKVLRDPLYVEVRILGMTDPGVVLILDHCWATTAPQRDSLPQWDLLFDGCSFQDDRYMTVPIPVGTTSGLSCPSHYKRFALRMFTFVDPTSMVHLKEKVYIHCSTAVCHHQAGSCEQKCQMQNPADNSERTKTDCEQHRDNPQKSPTGAFVPQCDEQGQYKAMQCYNSTGSCWCVDSRGQERAGSRTEPGTSQPNCDEPESEHPKRAKTDCENQRDSVLSTDTEVDEIVEVYVPQCDEQGQYKAMQCQNSTGPCWCVDSTGQERAGTRNGPGTSQPNCDEPESEHPKRNKTDCENQRDSMLSTNREVHDIVEVYVPQCDEQGQYKAMQCQNSTGPCWCVDSTGQERAGTRNGPSTDKPNCDEPETDFSERAKTDCEKQRDSEQTTNSSGQHIVGDFKPQCDEQGHYKAWQCSTEYCWCVDKTGQEIAGTKTPPGAPPPSCNRPREDLSVQGQRKTTGDVVVSSQEVIMIDPEVFT